MSAPGRKASSGPMRGIKNLLRRRSSEEKAAAAGRPDSIKHKGSHQSTQPGTASQRPARNASSFDYEPQVWNPDQLATREEPPPEGGSAEQQQGADGAAAAGDGHKLSDGSRVRDSWALPSLSRANSCAVCRPGFQSVELTVSLAAHCGVPTVSRGGLPRASPPTCLHTHPTHVHQAGHERQRVL